MLIINLLLLLQLYLIDQMSLSQLDSDIATRNTASYVPYSTSMMVIKSYGRYYDDIFLSNYPKINRCKTLLGLLSIINKCLCFEHLLKICLNRLNLIRLQIASSLDIVC